MKTKLFSVILFLLVAKLTVAQGGWSVCNSPAFGTRVDDIFMLNTKTGYAICGDGQIVKTTNSGNDWVRLLKDNMVYYRSVEFINENEGFVGGFPIPYSAGRRTVNMLKKTTDGGLTWTDLTLLLDTVAQHGICGLCAADSNVIYGSGNWYDGAGYIVKSIDRGVTWTFINMARYATSIIDMNFLNKDTGFVTGKGPLPDEKPVILYTTDGGNSWSVKFDNYNAYGYCWKIQHVAPELYYASIEEFDEDTAHVLKSVDGGMSWNIISVSPQKYNIEGIGFIDALHGWTGGGPNKCFETTDGGTTWDSIPVCPLMNRVFKVNDTMLFATGNQIWRYRTSIETGVKHYTPSTSEYATLKCYPNPVKDNLTLEVSLTLTTRVMIIILDSKGMQVSTIENVDKQKGKYVYNVNTSGLAPGAYTVLLKTHEDNQVAKIIVTR